MKPDVVIGIPNTGSIKTYTAMSLVGILRLMGKDRVAVVAHESCYVQHNRTMIVEEARKMNAGHLFFLDSDVVVPTDIIGRLLGQRKEIIGASYNHRSLPLRSTVRIADETGKLVKAAMPQEPFRCYAVPTGAMLIDLSVFDRIERPWFHVEERGAELMGDDVWFCQQATKAGIEVWCDPRIPVKHLGDFPY